MAKKKTLLYERWVRIQCPECDKYVALPDCGIPDTIKCDMCMEVFETSKYELKEYKRRAG